MKKISNNPVKYILRSTLVVVLMAIIAVFVLHREPVMAYATPVVPGDPIPQVVEETVPETVPETEPYVEPTVPQPQPTDPQPQPTEPQPTEPQPEETIPEETIEETEPEEPEHTHRKRATDVAATCTTAGYHHVECVDCGEVLEHTVVEAHGHNMGGWYVVKEATYTEQGLKRCDCNNGCGHYETAPIAMLERPVEETEPAPTEPQPTEPQPTEPAPTEPAPTEPAPTEPVEGAGASDDCFF